jgi:hypothetical protein
MKYVLALILCAVSYSALAAASHWVEVARPVSASGPTIIYFDDANRVVEGSYKGFNIKTEFSKPFSTTSAQGNPNVTFKAVVSQFVYDCQAHKGMGRRIGFVGINGVTYPSTDTVWRNVSRPPATDTLMYVQQRVC